MVSGKKEAERPKGQPAEEQPPAEHVGDEGNEA